jgi:hypothetical protein
MSELSQPQVPDMPPPQLVEQRQAAAQQEAKLLQDAADRHDATVPDGAMELVFKRNQLTRLSREKPSPTIEGMLDGVQTELDSKRETHDARTAHLRQVGSTILKATTNEPEAVAHGYVLNPDRAEAMAHAEAPHRDKARKSWFRKGRHLQRATKAGEAAAQAYTQDIKDEIDRPSLY